MMGIYFKPLRRKIGVVTLMLACLFAAGWVRSRSIIDNFGGPTRGRFEVGINSIDNSIDLTLFVRGTSNETVWRMPDHDSCENVPLDVVFDGFIWVISLCGFKVGYQLPPQCCHTVCLIPYWSIVIPLTLLSAWLLLSKPRTKPEPPPITPASENA
jgi:hypothetical protein